MGNVCCGGKEEGTKASALDDVKKDANSPHLQNPSKTLTHESSEFLVEGGGGGGDHPDTASMTTTSKLTSQDAAAAASASAALPSGHHPNNNNNNNKNQVDTDQFQKLRQEQARLDLIVQMTGRGMVSVRSTRGSTGYYDQGFAAALGQHLEQTAQFTSHIPILLPAIAKPGEEQVESTITNNNNNNNTTTTTTSNNTSAAPTTTNTTTSTLNTDSSSGMTTTTTTTTTTAADTAASESTSTGDTTTAAIANNNNNHNNHNKNDTIKHSSLYGRLSQPPWDHIYLTKEQGANLNQYIDHVAESYLDAVIPQKERLFVKSGPILENLL